MNYAIAFISGFLVDLAYVAWVASIGRNHPIRAGLSSMAVGLAGLCGLVQALDSNLAAGAYLLGLGCGTVAGVLCDRTKG